MVINWSEKFEFGIESIDNQHKKIVGYINELEEYLNHEDFDKEKALTIVDSLIQYTKSHFKHEEKLFEIHQYAHETDHINKHNDFIKVTRDLQEAFIKNPHDISNKLQEYLVAWIIEHILIEDRRYRELFTAKNVT